MHLLKFQINYDFLEKYPKAGRLTHELEYFLQDVIPIFESRMKDQTCRAILQQLKELPNTSTGIKIL